jgi:pimeloyl-ACP methyl ester carboxylesterase
VRRFCVLTIQCLAFLLLSNVPSFAADPETSQRLPALVETTVESTLDGEKQAVLYWAPEAASQKKTPLLVFLHSWSGDYKQDNSKWQKEAVKRGWIFLHPDFRGANNAPKACGSKFARQDILDAMAFAESQFRIDSTRVYLAGISGGGHMAMLMAGHHPKRFSAVSAWVGISDLAEWYRFHAKDGKPARYAQMILNSLGGPPEEDPKRDADYRDRSPLFHLASVGELPIDLYAGVRDGHTGSVPIMHTLKAFNVIAAAHGTRLISVSEMSQLWDSGKLSSPLASDTQLDKELTRGILLRRTSRAARATIFDGAHEGLPAPACHWLGRQRRESSPQTE